MMWTEVLDERLARINETIRMLRQESPFYARKLLGVGLEPLGTIREIATLPLTTREELQASGSVSYLRRGKQPHGYFESSGTSGQPHDVAQD